MLTIFFICSIFAIFSAVNLNVAQGFKAPSLYQVTPPVDHGEGPVWDPRVGILYFVDLHNGKILGYHYETDKVTFSKEWCQSDVATVLPSKNDPNLLVVGVNRSVTIAYVNETSSNEDGCINNLENLRNQLVTVQQSQPKSRFNDGKTDSKGRIWIGTMGYEHRNGTLELDGGKLFKITRENINEPEIVISPVNISNGLAWNKADDKFYYIDTPSQKILEFDYDSGSGTIINKRAVFYLKENELLHNCYPDGMTIDENDNLWIALYGCGSIIHVDPSENRLLQQIPIPSKFVTSVAWGGPNLDILFVTTSRYSLSDKERTQQPGAGSLYALKNLGVKGLASYYADIS